jgi:S1-C subfamily serine protease
MAVIAFILALIGIPLLGVPGLVAVALGAVAAGAINANRELKGAGLAVAAIIVGVLQVVGWTAGLCLYLLTRTPGDPGSAVAPIVGEHFDLDDVADAPDHIRRAIQCNVLIAARGRGQSSEGSGVVVEGRDGRVFVLTNRHVIEAAAGGGRVEVTFPDGGRAGGDVVWQGGEALDVAVISCPQVSATLEAARIRPEPSLTIGETVFAIGNPLGLGWSYSGGAVSAIRRLTAGDRAVRIIQIQLPLNPGHSGGGLYDAGGTLIGLNTMTTDKHVSEGIGFALAVFDLIPVLEDQAGLTLRSTHGDRP